MSALRLRYRQPATPLIGAVLLFAAALAALAHRAATNNRELVLNGLIHLEVGAATVFYAGLAAVSAGFVLIGAVGLFRSLLLHEYVVVDSERLVVPGLSWFPVQRRVPLDSIRFIEMGQATRNRFLTVVHEEGRLHVPERMVGDEGLGQLRDALHAACAPADEA